MNQTIEVTPTVYKRLEALVIGFDTPSKVVERLLDSYEGTAKKGSNTRHKAKRLYSNSEIQKLIADLASSFTESQLEKYCDKQFSKEQLGISFPLFISVPATSSQATRREAVKASDGIPRWTWKFEFQKYGRSYAICTQWYAGHDQKVKTWLKENS